MKAGKKILRMKEESTRRHNRHRCTATDTIFQKDQFQPFPGIAGIIQRKSQPSCPCDGGCPRCVDGLKGGGQSLDESSLAYFEPRFGRDFGNVKVHNDAKAAAAAKTLNAKAFTVGNDIYFADGQYKPGRQEGKELLGHELTHTVQQTEKQVPKGIQRKLEVKEPGEKSPHPEHKDKTRGEVLLELFNQLCPDTTWKLDSENLLKPGKEDFCSSANIKKSETATSCGCICHFISPDPPHATVAIDLENDQTTSREADTYKVLVTGKDAESIKGIKGTAEEGNPLKVIEDPAFVILGHELCGHAMTSIPLSKDTTEPSEYYHESTEQSDKTAIDIENRIRAEHSKGDTDLGVRAGEFWDSDDNKHYGALVRMPKEMKLKSFLEKLNVPVESHTAECYRSDLFYVGCGVKTPPEDIDDGKKYLKDVSMLSRVTIIAAEREGQKLPYKCRKKKFSKDTYFNIEGVFWHRSRAGDTKASIAALWGVTVDLLDQANQLYNNIHELKDTDPLPEGSNVIIPYPNLSGDSRPFFKQTINETKCIW